MSTSISTSPTVSRRSALARANGFFPAPVVRSDESFQDPEAATAPARCAQGSHLAQLRPTAANPSALVIFALLAPPSWVVVRLGVGILLVIGFSALVGVVRRRGSADLPATRDAVAAAAEPLVWREVPRRVLVRFARLAIVLAPEYLVVVFVVGLIGAPLGALLGHGGALAVLLTALVATVLVLPTAGEIPILLGRRR